MNALTDKLSRYRACMLLGGVGDAIAYNDGKWEYCVSGEKIQEEVRCLGGVSSLRPSPYHMIVSDDTIMHIATAEGLLCNNLSDEEQYCSLARKYKHCMRDMVGRSPGNTCISSVKLLFPEYQTYTIPFTPGGGGCGAAMRAVPIGLLYHRLDELNNLVRVGIESGRMTHNHPTGFLGSMTVALFVSYAIQGKDVREWGEGLLHTLHIAKQYCEEQKRDWELIKENWSYFEESWKKYLREVNPRFGYKYHILSPNEYDHFFLPYSYSGLAGSSGHDAPMIAYDAIIRTYQMEDPYSRWERLCRYGMFHGGDSDSTGIIAGACYGAMYGLEGVPLNNHTQLEYRDRLERLGSGLYHRTHPFVKPKTEENYDYCFDNSFEYNPQKPFDPFSTCTKLATNRGNGIQKKKVTFNLESLQQPTYNTEFTKTITIEPVEHDLFHLGSKNNSILSSKDFEIKSSRYRSDTLADKKFDTFSVDTDINQRLLNLRMSNTMNHLPDRSYRTTSNIQTNLKTNFNEIIQLNGPNMKQPDYSGNIIQPHNSYSPTRSDVNSRTVSCLRQSSVPTAPINRVVKLPPKFSATTTNSLSNSINSNNTVACSYGGTDR
ncbi:Protein ADP-ribosylarginine hydrolase-like [Oopsacas minuta]|uniref:ADP-ribosylhydrolase ARH1 n=1 Tax=Oopsacas minuta TaxID=111878 RepID=A0AAV7KGF9_9METZ|nr:Protein ADP-ribosylarginine hydrolase-like [Oopsacas minuta]